MPCEPYVPGPVEFEWYQTLGWIGPYEDLPMRPLGDGPYAVPEGVNINSGWYPWASGGLVLRAEGCLGDGAFYATHGQSLGLEYCYFAGGRPSSEYDPASTEPQVEWYAVLDFCYPADAESFTLQVFLGGWIYSEPDTPTAEIDIDVYEVDPVIWHTFPDVLAAELADVEGQADTGTWVTNPLVPRFDRFPAVFVAGDGVFTRFEWSPEGPIPGLECQNSGLVVECVTHPEEFEDGVWTFWAEVVDDEGNEDMARWSTEIVGTGCGCASLTHPQLGLTLVPCLLVAFAVNGMRRHAER